MEALRSRRPPSEEQIGADTKIITLIEIHIDRLEEDDRSGATIETYRRAAATLAKPLTCAPSGFRTPDPLIKSQLLYQLS